MVFNSVVFLFCFLPLSLLLYYLVPGRAKNAVLLAESLIFYCWTGVAFLPLIAVLIVFNYLWALLTARAKAKLRGLLPLAAVLVNLGVLVYFKYANFLIDTVNQVAHLGLAALNIGTVLPLGAHDDRPDYDYLDGVELHVYQLADGESETVEIPDTKGNVAATFTVTMKDGQAQVETDSTKPYTVVVHQ